MRAAALLGWTSTIYVRAAALCVRAATLLGGLLHFFFFCFVPQVKFVYFLIICVVHTAAMLLEPEGGSSCVVLEAVANHW